MRTTPDLQPERRYRRTVFILQLLLGLLLLSMVVIAGLSITGGARFLFPPTPTLTATPAPRLTSTPDFRARLIAEDRATQDAYRTLVAASNGEISPLGLPTIFVKPTMNVMLPIVSNNPDAAATAISADNQPTSVVHIPIVNNPQPVSQLPTPIDTLQPGEPPPDTTPSDGGPSQEVPTETPTDTPSPTVTPAPTDTPLPTNTLAADVPTATPTPFLVANLRAFVTATAGATLYIGPSLRYTATSSVAYNQELSLRNRDETGEWVAFCCIPNTNDSYWLRQVYAPPRDNALQPGAPAGANANDVRWLAVLPAPTLTPPIQTPTPIPSDAYPFYRMRRGNNAQLPSLPQAPIQTDWFNPFQVVGPIIAPVIVTGGFVIIGGDDNHIYALDRVFGNQQHSFNIGQKMAFGPVAQDGVIYFVDRGGFSHALNLNLQQIWRSTINGAPVTPLYLADTRLLIAAQESDGVRRILAIDRSLDKNGTVFPERYDTTDLFPAMAVGNQLLYIGDPSLRAIDIHELTLVWQQEIVSRLTAPPVYVNDGPLALAELYVADDQNRLHLVDANTGRIIWTAAVGARITGLTVGGDAIYATGANFILAWPRRNGNQLWRVDLPGEPRSGPIIGGNQILIVTNNGTVRLFDLNGLDVANAVLASGVQATEAPAVSGQYIYIPGNDGKVHAFRGQ